MKQARRRAFLRALGATGNVKLAAAKAKLSYGWIKLLRRQDADFDAACRAKIEEAERRLRARADVGDCRPPRGWRYLDGEELVVRSTRSGRTQICRAKLQQWSPSSERRFLDALASTCNVQAACAEVGMSVGSAYRHRKRFPAFERAWDEAVKVGYTQLEDALVLAGRNIFADEEGELEPSPIREMTAAQAIHLLHMHKHHVHGVGQGPRKILRSSVDEATERLTKLLRAMAREQLHEGDEEGRAWGERMLRIGE